MQFYHRKKNPNITDSPQTFAYHKYNNLFPISQQLRRRRWKIRTKKNTKILILMTISYFFCFLHFSSTDSSRIEKLNEKKTIYTIRHTYRWWHSVLSLSFNAWLLLKSIDINLIMFFVFSNLSLVGAFISDLFFQFNFCWHIWFYTIRSSFEMDYVIAHVSRNS